jgi:hypothetical protein
MSITGTYRDMDMTRDRTWRRICPVPGKRGRPVPPPNNTHAVHV